MATLSVVAAAASSVQVLKRIPYISKPSVRTVYEVMQCLSSAVLWEKQKPHKRPKS